MQVKSINRSAVLTWNPKFDILPTVASGTVSTVAKHSNNSKFELFDLSTKDPQELLSINVPSSFNKIIWTSVEGNNKDLVVGSFEDGRIEIYDIQMLLNAESSGIIEPPILHSGPVKGLGLSCFQPNLLASGSANGEIALWDLDNIKKSSLITVKKSEKYKNTSDLAWNPHIPHIIAASSFSGTVSIIDLRSKKEITSIELPESIGASNVSWNPESPTSILTASNDDTHPYVFLWDLKTPKLPQNVFKGHSKKITSLSWCQIDSGLVLSSGKDSKVICWSPNSNEIFKEYSCENVFDVHWCPKNPDFICMSSYNNGIEFRPITEAVVHSDETRENDSMIIPKWYGCPIGASFGGGNSCSVFRSINKNVLTVNLKNDVVSKLHGDLIQFEYEICKENIVELCNSLVDKINCSDKKIFLKMIKALVSTDAKTEIFNLIKKEKNEDTSNLSIAELQSSRKIDSPISSNPHGSKSFDLSITEKLIKSDFEGAMFDCINANRFVDAIIISDCGGKELRDKAEEHLLKNNNTDYLYLAKSIRTNNFEDFVFKTSLQEWRKIYEVICTMASPESVMSLGEIFSIRLIGADLHHLACYSLILSKNLEKLMEIILKRFLVKSLDFCSVYDILESLIFIYKIIRILNVHNAGFVNSFKNHSNKVAVFEVLIKLNHILSSFGINDCILNVLESNFYEDYIKGKNSEIDSVFEGQIHKNAHSLYKKSSPENSLTSTTIHSNNLKLSTTYSSPTVFTSSVFPVPSWQLSNAKYNDVPIINPNLSKLGPRCDYQELKLDVVIRALIFLKDAIEFKGVTEANSRLAKECFKKLVPEIICLKEYSKQSKSSIVILFNELSLGHLGPSSVLVTNILASFFSETKEWILSLKRLIEIAKN